MKFQKRGSWVRGEQAPLSWLQARLRDDSTPPPLFQSPLRTVSIRGNTPTYTQNETKPREAPDATIPAWTASKGATEGSSLGCWRVSAVGLGILQGSCRDLPGIFEGSFRDFYGSGEEGFGFRGLAFTRASDSTFSATAQGPFER